MENEGVDTIFCVSYSLPGGGPNSVLYRGFPDRRSAESIGVLEQVVSLAGSLGEEVGCLKISKCEPKGGVSAWKVIRKKSDSLFSETVAVIMVYPVVVSGVSNGMDVEFAEKAIEHLSN